MNTTIPNHLRALRITQYQSLEIKYGSLSQLEEYRVQWRLKHQLFIAGDTRLGRRSLTEALNPISQFLLIILLSGFPFPVGHQGLAVEFRQMELGGAGAEIPSIAKGIALLGTAH
jgi:hypothetical protein